MVRLATLICGLSWAGAAAAQTAAPLSPAPEADLMALVLKAHPVVQGVMGILALAVFLVLTILIYKLTEMTLAVAGLRRSGQALAQGLATPVGDCPLAAMARMAADELAALPPKLSADLRASARDRLTLGLARIEAGAVQRLRVGTGVLASIGSVGPFVGLFGTVFGIMNSFQAIAATRTTNLAVVAPGIAEALLATALGLVAAIPAVLVHNHLMRRLQTFRHRLADGQAEVTRHFIRALDARSGG